MTPRSLLEPARLAGTSLLRAQSDERLVDLTRAGNARAFEAIVQRYRRPLLRYLSRLLPLGQVEDTLQLAFMRAYEAMLANEAELDLRPWLYRITHNAAVDALRRGEQRGHEQLDESVDGVERPDQALERREHLAMVLAAVDALPPRQRNAVVLRELEGRSYQEIAEALGISGGAVKMLLNRARATLRAGATALTPLPLVTRAAAGEGESIAARVAEVCTGGAGASLLVKAGAAVVVTGAVAGGVAQPHLPGRDGDRGGPEPAAAASETGDASAAGESASAPEPTGDRGQARQETTGGEDRGDRRSEDEDRSGPGDGDDEADDDSSGPGSGDELDDDSSGPGSGGDVLDDDNSGPGSRDRLDDDNSGPGSGDELDDDNSGAGSGDDALETDDDSSGPGSGDD